MDFITQIVGEKGITKIIFQMKEDIEETERLNNFISKIKCELRYRNKEYAARWILEEQMGLEEILKDDLVEILMRDSTHLNYTKTKKLKKQEIMNYIYEIIVSNKKYLLQINKKLERGTKKQKKIIVLKKLKEIINNIDNLSEYEIKQIHKTIKNI